MQSDLPATVRRYHHYLDELLLLHQEALLEKDIALALGFWRLHGEMLRLHIELEEALLLPALERAVDAPAWAANLYRAEHRKVLQLADKLGDALGAIELREPTRRELIALLDKQRSYKNVLEHHEEREEKGLLPELAAALQEREISEMNSCCGEAWQALQERQLATVRRLTSCLDDY